MAAPTVLSNLDPVTACLIAAVMVGVIFIMIRGARTKRKTSMMMPTSKMFAKRKLFGVIGKQPGSGTGTGKTNAAGKTKGVYGLGGSGSSGFMAEAMGDAGASPVSKFLAQSVGQGEHPSTYNYHANAREMFAGTSTPPAIAATPNQSAAWVRAQAMARASAEPRTSLDSQLVAPVVSSMDPQNMTENPMDPYLENITFHLTAYKNRNTNFDPRGQPALDPNFLTGSDQLVQIRNVERLAYHGPGHQITGCAPAAPPRY